VTVPFANFSKTALIVFSRLHHHAQGDPPYLSRFFLFISVFSMLSDQSIPQETFIYRCALITISIPTSKKAKYMEHSFQSAAGQTISSIAIVIVNDTSEDKFTFDLPPICQTR
jgi:hypothetical protein